ncbi:hypothetical protein B0H16DRAFT_946102 [Mycena metata]|uniref:Uncharacterized protein n=1 Tax=Mycena metata TaxID=1033252 RepID=A0AAD7K2L6_9AGAR|nr:hypothetical protein B0H16DRAFT_946102 [Mycena metata]
MPCARIHPRAAMGRSSAQDPRLSVQRWMKVAGVSSSFSLLLLPYFFGLPWTTSYTTVTPRSLRACVVFRRIARSGRVLRPVEHVDDSLFGSAQARASLVSAELYGVDEDLFRRPSPLATCLSAKRSRVVRETSVISTFRYFHSRGIFSLALASRLSFSFLPPYTLTLTLHLFSTAFLLVLPTNLLLFLSSWTNTAAPLPHPPLPPPPLPHPLPPHPPPRPRPRVRRCAGPRPSTGRRSTMIAIAMCTPVPV